VAQENPVDLMLTVDRFFMSQHIVAGQYVRFSTEDVQHLKSEAVRIRDACEISSKDRENFFVWGHPGEGKTFFVSEIAKQAGVHYEEVNLNDSKRVPDANALEGKLSSLETTEHCVLCALDEIDKRPEASDWLYATIFTFLDGNKKKESAGSPNKVFILIGSEQPDYAAFLAKIKSRYAGKDLIRRVVHPEIKIPKLNIGDRMVTSLSMIWGSRFENTKITSVSSLAVAYLLATHLTNGAIAEATGKALAHMKNHETSFTANHLQLRLEAWESFYNRYPLAKSTLFTKFVNLQP
jgi:hypothetical protein